MALAEALAESEAMTGQQPGHRPPASKHAVKALTRETLSEQRLKQLGGPDVQCSVCRWVHICNAHALEWAALLLGSRGCIGAAQSSAIATRRTCKPRLMHCINLYESFHACC